MEIVKVDNVAAKEASKFLNVADDYDEAGDKKKTEYHFDLNTRMGLIQFMTEPYFKSTVEDGIFMTAPILEDNSRKDIQLPFRLTYVLQRQECSQHEIKLLKLCVIRTLREELERKLAEHFDSCLLKMDLTEKEMESIKACQTETQIVDTVVKICSDREVDGKKEPSYAPVMYYVNCPGRKFTVLSETKNLYDLVQYKTECTKNIANIDFVEFSRNYPIDWLAVSAKLYNLHHRFRTPEEWELIWKWNHSPGICRDPFGLDEIEQVVNVLAEIGTRNMWHHLPERLNKGRTDFDYFRMYASLPKSEMVYKIPKELRRQLVASYFSYQDYEILAAKLCEFFPQMNADIARILYIRILNPMLRKMNFSPIEDAILLVVMELRKEAILDSAEDENVYYLIMESMPWRYMDILRERFESLFQWTFYPFTIEEDRLLLAAVHLIGRDWEKISQLFNSNKTRKMCACRYKQIRNWTEAELEQHHVFKSRPYKLNFSSPLMHALYQISILLMEWEKRDYISVSQLSRDEPPTDNALHLYIRSFPRAMVQAAFDRVSDYCHENLEYRPPAPSRMVCTRRLLFREQPISWASALHLRNVTLKPMECIEEPTDFELAIYAHYKKYKLGGRAKLGPIRHGLPTAEELVKFPEISRIVDKGQESVIAQPQPPPTPICNINVKVEMERIQKLENEGIDKSEAENPLATRAVDYAHHSGNLLKKEPKSEKLENTQELICSLQTQTEDNERNKESNSRKINKGPKSKRISEIRKEAAKARWAKKKESELKAESPVETTNIKVDMEVKPKPNSSIKSIKPVKSSAGALKVNIKKESVVDFEYSGIGIVKHDHPYYTPM